MNSNISYKTIICIFLSAIGIACYSQTSNLVSIDADGVLSYTPDNKGNIIPDFSMVGYHQSETMIPDVPVQITLNPGNGDRYTDIQNAIDQVASLTPDKNGHRGAILLTAGIYQVGQTLNINNSGIIIRGEGKDNNGTIIELTANTQTNLFDIHGSSNVKKISSTTKQITDAYVPIGSKTINVESDHSFQIDDRVIFSHTVNEDWISLLGMDQLEATCGTGHTNWSSGTTHYKRKIKDISGNQITLDAPVVDPVDPLYSTATLSKYIWPGKIEECGVENIQLRSSYTSNTDEKHGWMAIEFRNIENAWVRNVDAYYFGLSCVAAIGGSYQITIENSGMYDYKSLVTGGRRYGFYTDDCDLILVKNCSSDKGRHDFAQGSKTPGPNVYTNCIATNSTADLGPHHRWSTGTLWDNVTTNCELNVQNRLCSGSGHGWSGAQQVFWNCTANKIILHDPPAYPTNWAIGCTSNHITNVGNFNGVVEPLGIVESQNNPISSIPNLYEAQLYDRLNNTLKNSDSNIKNDLSNHSFAYPNPVKDKLFFKNLNPHSSLKIYNNLGQLIIEKYDVNTINVSSLETGLFFVVIANNAGIKTMGFIKE